MEPKKRQEEGSGLAQQVDSLSLEGRNAVVGLSSWEFQPWALVFPWIPSPGVGYPLEQTAQNRIRPLCACGKVTLPGGPGKEPGPGKEYSWKGHRPQEPHPPWGGTWSCSALEDWTFRFLRFLCKPRSGLVECLCFSDSEECCGKMGCLSAQGWEHWCPSSAQPAVTLC